MQKKPTVLIIEDEEKIRRMLRLFLEQAEINVLEATDGEPGLALIAQQRIDLVILDLMMPGMDGWTTCRKLREKWDLPILILTARGEEADRVLGFELGTDDYVVKPFSPREIVLRVKALLRRHPGGAIGQSPATGGEEALHFPRLSLYPAGRKVVAAGKVLPLSPLEYNLLLFLARYPGRVFTRDTLLDRVWGYDYIGDSRTVDTHIRRLREKLARASTQAAGYIATVRGTGYKFEVAP
ncbi:MAG: response regulator transcription factor [Heliobacteriaceae bacterium]|nr:response regulator transcription factor [Heliobacteriaceae bacterium]